jgi:glyoxylate reductase
MNVLYFGRSRNEEAERELGARLVDFDTLLAESDFISVHTVMNDSTKHLFNADAFRKMKRSAIFINTARGGIVNEADLTAALRNGDIFAAGLDVTDPEPPAFDNPLLYLPNCVVAPHIGSATVSSRNGMAEIAADNLLAGLAGKPLRHCVNP